MILTDKKTFVLKMNSRNLIGQILDLSRIWLVEKIWILDPDSDYKYFEQFKTVNIYDSDLNRCYSRISSNFDFIKMSGRGKGGKGSSSKTRSSRAGLQYPVGRIHRLLKNGSYAERIGAGASVYLAAVME